VRAAALAPTVGERVRAQLDRIDGYAGELLAGTLALDRWPLRAQ
jgi:hypothetical protein